MIAFEIAFLTFLGVVLVVGIAAIGRPMAEVYAEKLKHRYRELGSDAEIKLKMRVTALEQEVGELRRQLSAMQESAHFKAEIEKGSAEVKSFHPPD